ncbi:MAG: FAD-dependent oxidoreductase [Alphaproteobacteria bacterium]|nr:FAD-dependent oxidoreductase [Alphaproteobacteria bacterium]MDE2074579.1 NAD(P)/FAD-dependent oxidoreductase [Alphaproteobacteria bacterium]
MTKKTGKTGPARGRALGMDRAIDRRDFLNGMAVSAATLAMMSRAEAQITPGNQHMPGYYPPLSHGLRGSHPGSFEVAHALRDGTFWEHAKKPEDTHALYDLVIVGGGISGLSAAYFYRQARPHAKILILENHDDFGGHAKRNEYDLNGRLELMNGGTMLIDSPRPYSKVAAGLIAVLGIRPAVLAKQCDKPEIYRGLSSSTFFDRETFGKDALVVGCDRENWGGGTVPWKDFLAKAPLDAQTQADILRVEKGEVDWMPNLGSDEKKDRLSRMSYRDYLKNIVKVNDTTLAFFQTITHGEYGVGIDAEPALDCWGFGYPGFKGLKLKPGSTARMGNTAAGYQDNPGLPTFHFPDGNASIARLLVRNLIPDVLPGHTAEDVVTARANYAALDKAGAPVAIRLSSTVVGVRNIGSPENAKGVEIAYANAGNVYRVHAANCVLAGWNMMIPYLCPELPETQKEALHALVKIPLVYTSVAVRNWQAWHRLGIKSISAPGGYFTGCQLNWPVDVGGYRSVRSPDDPMLLFMVRTPVKPGLPERDQHRAGRAELLATSLETFEEKIRDQLNRMLGAGGFDAARDIVAITVNRWPHGYAYEFNPLFDDFSIPPDKRANVIGRQRFGRITIANSDSGAAAYTDSAIDQAFRAVNELLAL